MDAKTTTTISANDTTIGVAVKDYPPATRGQCRGCDSHEDDARPERAACHSRLHAAQEVLERAGKTLRHELANPRG